MFRIDRYIVIHVRRKCFVEIDHPKEQKEYRATKCHYGGIRDQMWLKGRSETGTNHVLQIS